MKANMKEWNNMIFKRTMFAFLVAVLLLCSTAPVQAYAIAIDTQDGATDDWNDKAGHYVYNWDNSANCWEHGVWINGECYKTPKGKYSTDVRHYVQAFKNEAGVALHIVFSRDYGAGANGDDFNFKFLQGDGNHATKFRIALENGNSLSYTVNSLAPGVHPLKVFHSESRYSGREAAGATATLYIPKEKVNREIEVFIPYTAFKTQNPAIDINKVSRVSFKTQNLMYDEIYIEGAPTGSIISMVAGLGLASVYFAKKKERLNFSKKKKAKV